MPRKAIALLSAMLLFGCSSPAINQCEQYLLSNIKAPSSYKRVASSGTAVPFENPKYYFLKIDYDALNSYGVAVRETQFCVFPFKDGGPDTSKPVNFDRTNSEAAAAAVEDAVRADNFDRSEGRPKGP